MRVVNVLPFGHSRMASSDTDATADEPKYLSQDELELFEAEDVYGCALPNLLRDGYVVRNVKLERDNLEEPVEYWKVTLRRRREDERMQRAFIEDADGYSNFLCGDPERYAARYSERAHDAVRERDWRILRRTRGPDDECWLTIVETDSAERG